MINNQDNPHDIQSDRYGKRDAFFVTESYNYNFI